ncbi:amidohydrolase/deacetylase family metallohydrolase [Cupriavidus gilardii]|uniref:amidohydrolase/deacetylase family metallohydrolase n=3 Tax=Cupriavidus gilardii TaxID=82541 RepID=UPI001573265B|nr:amidohydrolase/deacetylase family metallohydrolase [Cupriavidus gilardii]NSX04055.1 amidohydrolase/deacetylase family metallohydrolase [Cupriavidus gilardii]
MTASNRDIVLRQGRVIDPDAGIDAVCDVWIRNGRIAAVGDSSLALPAEATAADVIDCRGKLVLPGLIDTHAHVYQYVTGRFGLNADMCGVQSGVTTLIDQGGASCMTLPGFRHYVAEPASSRIYAFLSAYLVGGLEGHYYAELYRPECVDVDATVKAALANADLVRGIKAHAELGGFARWGVEVMRASAEIGRQTGLPVYVHFGQLWPMPGHAEHEVDPDTILEQVVDMLKPGDVLAHPFSRHPGGFVNRDGTVHPLAREAAARGLKIDVGHGSHFSYRMARTVLQAGIVPDTLGADMHGYNTHVPAPAGTPAEHPDQDHMFLGRVRFSLVSAMTSMLALGLPLDHVVRMATVNAARMAGLNDGAGTLRVGAEANVSVLEDLRGRWVLADNEGTQVVAERMLEPAFCLRAGQRFDAGAPILPVAQVA